MDVKSSSPSGSVCSTFSHDPEQALLDANAVRKIDRMHKVNKALAVFSVALLVTTVVLFIFSQMQKISPFIGLGCFGATIGTWMIITAISSCRQKIADEHHIDLVKKDKKDNSDSKRVQSGEQSDDYKASLDATSGGRGVALDTASDSDDHGVALDTTSDSDGERGVDRASRRRRDGRGREERHMA